ncbi:MAG: thioesterase [Deltaproteobacteria bacterium]|nr:MAG: thioesterase [Deltaproteobacteria bacterium]
MSEIISRTKIRVLYADTDAGGVVYHANYLRYFEAGRAEYMRERISSYRSVEERGFILPLTESWLRYKAPAFYDDLLIVETTIEAVTPIKCTFQYKIYRQEDNGSEKLLVKGYTVHVAITREGKLTQLPEDMLQKIARYASKTDRIFPSSRQ